jgi:hypothetical protein
MLAAHIHRIPFRTAAKRSENVPGPATKPFSARLTLLQQVALQNSHGKSFLPLFGVHSFVNSLPVSNRLKSSELFG